MVASFEWWGVGSEEQESENGKKNITIKDACPITFFLTRVALYSFKMDTTKQTLAPVEMKPAPERWRPIPLPNFFFLSGKKTFRYFIRSGITFFYIKWMCALCVPWFGFFSQFFFYFKNGRIQLKFQLWLRSSFFSFSSLFFAEAMSLWLAKTVNEVRSKTLKFLFIFVGYERGWSIVEREMKPSCR